MRARWTEHTEKPSVCWKKKKKRWRTHIHTFADTHTKQALYIVQAGNENANDSHTATDILDIYNKCTYVCWIGAKDQNQKFIIIVVSRLHLLALYTLLFVIRFTRTRSFPLCLVRCLLSVWFVFGFWFFCCSFMDNFSSTLSYTFFSLRFFSKLA